MNNTVIADHFSLLAQLMDIHGENAFKAKTYSIAAYYIEKLDAPLATMEHGHLYALKGIGPNVGAKITELLQTGKLQLLDTYINSTPAGVLEMRNIKGLGPKKIYIIWKEMGITSIGELEYACNENRLTRYKGFGAKTQQNVLEAIQFYTQNIGHFLYAQVDAMFESIQQYLENLVGKENVLPTGAYRRQALTVEQLEFVINDTKEHIKPKFITAYPPELVEETDDSLLYKLSNGLQLRLYTNTRHIFQKQFLTSASAEFLEHFFNHYQEEQFYTESFTSEAAIFDAAGISYIPPYLRDTAAIINDAKAHTLPHVVQVKDIKGVIHNHSNWSDGTNTIEEMAMALRHQGYEYLVLSDHSKTATYANGLTEEKLIQQIDYINQLNKKLHPFKIFKSIESDILNDGSLDYGNDLLSQLDLVIASIHSNLYMKEEKAMERLLKAIENPYTTILGHPTGRLLLSRNGYPVHYETLIDACVKNNVVIEINANPRRLDLDWSWIPYAISKNAMLSINPDAHSIEGFKDIKYGVLASQKGMLTSSNNLSSLPLPAFEKFIAARRMQKKL